MTQSMIIESTGNGTLETQDRLTQAMMHAMSPDELIANIKRYWGHGEIVDDLICKYVSERTNPKGFGQNRDERITFASGKLFGIALNLRDPKGGKTAHEFVRALDKLIEEWFVRQWPVDHLLN